jgi:hypothetical protein
MTIEIGVWGVPVMILHVLFLFPGKQFGPPLVLPPEYRDGSGSAGFCDDCRETQKWIVSSAVTHQLLTQN